MKYRYLSHIVEEGMPVYGGKAEIKVRPVKAIAGGDSANVSSVSIVNHWGTHIDLPRHFFDDGPAVCDYPGSFWFFRSPCVVPVTLKPSQLLRCDRWCASVREGNDIILFRSMWSRRRSKRVYSLSNPGVDPEVAEYLRSEFANIRAIGIDWVSVSPFKDRRAGRNAHRAFLDPGREGHPIAIIEDMELGGSMKGLREIIALPFRISGIDSAPATIIGAFGD